MLAFYPKRKYHCICFFANKKIECIAFAAVVWSTTMGNEAKASMNLAACSSVTLFLRPAISKTLETSSGQREGTIALEDLTIKGTKALKIFATLGG